MDAARGEQHDRVAGASASPSDRRVFGLTMPVQAAARSMRPLSTMPASAGVSPPPQATPHGSQARFQPSTSACGALRVVEPVGAAGGPVRLDDERRGADGDQVVDRHRDRVLGDAGVEAAAGERGHLVGDERLRAEALDDAREIERADVDHIGRLAARRLDFAEAVAVEVGAGRERGALGVELERVDARVVDAGSAVAERAGRRRSG